MRCWRSSGKCVCCCVHSKFIIHIIQTARIRPGPLSGPGDNDMVDAGERLQGASQAVAGTWLDHMSVIVSRGTSAAAAARRCSGRTTRNV